MASQGYRDWLAAGRPYTLIRPAAAVQRTLRGYGLTVYDKPNQAHLEAITPEDHTSFSATGWPGKNARWKARALDVMPRNNSAAAAQENADIARQLIRDRDAGVPGVMWIKYLNWTSEDGTCRQERWMTAGRPLQRETRSSSDRGHIHISGRSDVDDDDRADGYDPIKRLAGLEPVEEGDVQRQVLVSGLDPDNPAQVYLCDGIIRRPVAPAELAIDPKNPKAGNPIGNLQIHQEGLLGNLGYGGNVFPSGGGDLWGVDVRTLGGGAGGGGELSDADVDRIARRFVELISARLAS